MPIDGGASLVLGAAAGAAFQELFNLVKMARKKAKMFEPRLSELETILEYSGFVVDMSKVNDELSMLMGKGKILVHKCNGFERWEYVRRIRYQRKLLKLNKKLVAFLILYIQSQNDRYQKKNRDTLLALMTLQSTMNL